MPGRRPERRVAPLALVALLALAVLVAFVVAWLRGTAAEPTVVVSRAPIADDPRPPAALPPPVNAVVTAPEASDRPLAPAADDAPGAPTRESLGAGETSLTGQFTLTTHLDPRPSEDGHLVLVGRSQRRGELRLEIPVVAGRFETVAPADALLEVASAELGGRPTVCAPAEIDLSRAQELEIRAAWAAPIVLHVVDAHTRAEVRGVRLLPLERGRAMPADPARAGGERPAGVDSPLTLATEMELHHDGFVFVTRTQVHVAADGYATNSVWLDFETGGDVVVELEPPARLEVSIDGTAPSEPGDEMRPLVRVRRYLEPRAPELRGGDPTQSSRPDDGASSAAVVLVPESSRQEWEVASQARVERGRADAAGAGERHVEAGLDGIARFDDLSAGTWLVTVEHVGGARWVVRGFGWDVIDPRETTLLGATRVNLREGEVASCRIAIAGDGAGAGGGARPGSVQLHLVARASGAPIDLSSLVFDSRGSLGEARRRVAPDLDAERGVVTLPRSESRFVEIHVVPRAAPWFAQTRFVVDLAAAPDEVTLTLTPATGLFVRIEAGAPERAEDDEAPSRARLQSVFDLWRTALVDEEGRVAAPFHFEAGLLFLAPHPGRWELRFPQGGLFGERAPETFELVADAVAETTITLGR